MNRDEIFLQELLRFREGVNINLGDKAPKISFNASYLVPAQEQGKPDTQKTIEIDINVLDSTQLYAVTQLKAASMLESGSKEFATAVQGAFNILAANNKDILPSLISSAGVLSGTGSGLRIIDEEVNSILTSITTAANSYSKIYPGDNASTISQLKNPEKFTGALNYLSLILYRDHIDRVLAQGNLPKDSLVYGTDGRLVNGKTAQSLILSADNNAILGSDIIAAYQPTGTKSGLEPNGRYSNFVCYLYYLDSLTGPNYTAPANVYTSKDKNTKYYRGTPKYIGMKDGMAYAPTAEDASKEGAGKKITYFRPLTSIKNFSINGLLISDNDTILLPYIYNYIIKSVEFAQYWFVEAREEDSLNKDSGTTIKNISGFTKEEVEQVRNVMSGILKNIAGNNGISMSQFGFAKESLSKSAIVRFKEAGEVEATSGEETTNTGTSNQTTKTTAKTTSSDSGGSLAAEITISLSDEDFEKLMKGPQEAPESNIQNDSSTTTQEDPVSDDKGQKGPEAPKNDGQEEDTTTGSSEETEDPKDAAVDSEKVKNDAKAETGEGAPPEEVKAETKTEAPEAAVEDEEEEVAEEVANEETEANEDDKEGDNGGVGV